MGAAEREDLVDAGEESSPARTSGEVQMRIGGASVAGVGEVRNFEGLEAFKSKFGGSHWDPVYASLAPGTALPRALLAVTAAFSGEPLRRFRPHLVWRAIARESRRLLHV